MGTYLTSPHLDLSLNNSTDQYFTVLSQDFQVIRIKYTQILPVIFLKIQILNQQPNYSGTQMLQLRLNNFSISIQMIQTHRQMQNRTITLNPQVYNEYNRSKLFKSPQKIGKIYAKVPQVNFLQSCQSLDLHNQDLDLKQEILLVQKALKLPVKSTYYQDSANKNHELKNINFSQMAPVTNKYFRINKVHSSQFTKFHKRKKTPEFIGKISTSKINVEVFQQNKDFQTKNIIKVRPPQPSKRNFSLNIHQNKKRESAINFKQKLTHEKSDLINAQTQRQRIPSGDLNMQNESLLAQVKHKQIYLKNLIDKHRREAGILALNTPVPKKNIQHFQHSYPVTGNNKNSFDRKKCLSPYLQKIQQNQRGFKSFICRPVGQSRIKNIQKEQEKKGNRNRKSRKEDAQEVLQKSRFIQLRISPEVNISFKIKTPRKSVFQDQIQHYQNGLFLQSKGNLSPVSTYSAQDNSNSNYGKIKSVSAYLATNNSNFNSIKIKPVSVYSAQNNKDFNNRKIKPINLLIDPLPDEYQNSFIQQNKDFNLSQFAFHFSRNNKQTSQQKNLILQQKDNRLEPINVCLWTKISTIKQILIESSDRIDLKLLLPSVLFQNRLIHKDVQVKDLHRFIQEVYLQMHIKPQIVTIKLYNNAIFTGIKKHTETDQKYFTSIIYHFDGAIYIGSWSQNQSQSKGNSKTIQGYKHGLGLQILYKNNKLEVSQNQQNQVHFEVYYGQFNNGLKKGYGIKLNIKFVNLKSVQQTVQIGCWEDSQKHGWVKTYENNELFQNSQYDHNTVVRKRTINPQVQN